MKKFHNHSQNGKVDNQINNESIKWKLEELHRIKIEKVGEIDYLKPKVAWRRGSKNNEILRESEADCITVIHKNEILQTVTTKEWYAYSHCNF